MRHEYCEKNGIIITYSDTDVAFEERDTAMSILISNTNTLSGKRTLKRRSIFWMIFIEYILQFAISGLLIRWEIQCNASIC